MDNGVNNMGYPETSKYHPSPIIAPTVSFFTYVYYLINAIVATTTTGTRTTFEATILIVFQVETRIRQEQFFYPVFVVGVICFSSCLC